MGCVCVGGGGNGWMDGWIKTDMDRRIERPTNATLRHAHTTDIHANAVFGRGGQRHGGRALFTRDKIKSKIQNGVFANDYHVFRF